MKNINKLTRGEKHCLLRIESIGKDIITKNISEISDLTCYSPATINRVIKKIGFSSIKEFRKSQLELYTSGENLLHNREKLKLHTYAADIILAEKITVLGEDFNILYIALKIRGFEVENQVTDEDSLIISNEHYKFVDLDTNIQELIMEIDLKMLAF